MPPVLCLYKPIGLTPLQAIEQLRKRYPEYADSKLSYAGRLDPMAEGLLLILVGEANKKRGHYQALAKEYEFSVLFGVSTDTYDTLGKVTHQTNQPMSQKKIMSLLTTLLPSFLGKHFQPYPPYSSRTVHGKPLYYWARRNKLSEIIIPQKEIEIYDLKLLHATRITKQILQTIILTRIAGIHGNFRQTEIIAEWKQFFLKNNTPPFALATLRVSCSSGTYIRSLAHEFGKKLGTHALAFSITRTRIGKYSLADMIYFD